MKAGMYSEGSFQFRRPRGCNIIAPMMISTGAMANRGIEEGKKIRESKQSKKATGESKSTRKKKEKAHQMPGSTVKNPINYKPGIFGWLEAEALLELKVLAQTFCSE